MTDKEEFDTSNRFEFDDGGPMDEAQEAEQADRIGEAMMAPPVPVSVSQEIVARPGVDPAIVAAAEVTRTQVQMQSFMAMQNPRNVQQSRARILQQCKRPRFAALAEYEKPIGGKKIRGPSIRLVEVVLREWGNTYTKTQTIYEDENVRRIEVMVMDLQTNVAYNEQIQISKTVERRKVDSWREVVSSRLNSSGQTVYIVKATDDELTVKTAAQVSKMIRNLGRRVLPQDLIEEAIDTARAAVRNQIKDDIGTYRQQISDAFVGIGIMPVDLEKLIGHPLDVSTAAELADLQVAYTSLRDGETTWTELLKAQDKTSGSIGETVADLAKELKEKHAAEADAGAPAKAAKKKTTAKKGGAK